MSAFTVCWIFQVDILGIKANQEGAEAKQYIFTKMSHLGPLLRNWPSALLWSHEFFWPFMAFVLPYVSLYCHIMYGNWLPSSRHFRWQNPACNVICQFGRFQGYLRFYLAVSSAALVKLILFLCMPRMFEDYSKSPRPNFLQYNAVSLKTE